MGFSTWHWQQGTAMVMAALLRSCRQQAAGGVKDKVKAGARAAAAGQEDKAKPKPKKRRKSRPAAQRQHASIGDA